MSFRSFTHRRTRAWFMILLKVNKKKKKRCVLTTFVDTRCLRTIHFISELDFLSVLCVCTEIIVTCCKGDGNPSRISHCPTCTLVSRCPLIDAPLWSLKCHQIHLSHQLSPPIVPLYLLFYVAQPDQLYTGKLSMDMSCHISFQIQILYGYQTMLPYWSVWRMGTIYSRSCYS